MSTTQLQPLRPATSVDDAFTSAHSPRMSLLGLNAANFFIAEIGGVVMPFLSDYLKMRQWRYDAIGVAAALAGLGVLLMQTPAGVIVDRVKHRRTMLAAASLAVGIGYGTLPLVADQWWFVDALLFFSGVSQAFFAPLLGALALGIVGYDRLSKTIGDNQGWNHAGNIAAALTAMALVTWFSTSSIFYAVAAVSALAAASVMLIRPGDIDERLASGASATNGASPPVRLMELMSDRSVAILFVAVELFHLANAPVMPLVAMNVKVLGGSDRQVAAVVLAAQVVMIPVALLAGWLCDRWGRKKVFSIGFVVLPIRIALYPLANSPYELVALQLLDGIGAGIYGVAIVALCADLARGTGRFNALLGLTGTALALGGVLGPIVAGVLLQSLGFAPAYLTLAAVAALGAVVFVGLMQETRAPLVDLAELGQHVILDRPGP